MILKSNLHGRIRNVFIDIRIENNTFFTFYIGKLFPRSVDGLGFKGNMIRRTRTYSPFGRVKDPLMFAACKNLEIEEDELCV